MSGVNTNSTQSDIGDLWKKAVDEFERTTNTKLDKLSPASNVEEILSIVQSQESRFNTFRHDKSRLDKFRSLVKRSLYPVEQMSKIISSAVTSVRCPASFSTAVITDQIHIIVVRSRLGDIRSRGLSCSGSPLH